MVFEFQLLSLLMIFLLVITYYSRKNISIKKNRLFRSLLLITYIMQLCSLSLYITFQTKNHIMLFSKVYLIAILLWFAGYSLYYGFNLLKSQYPNAVKRCSVTTILKLCMRNIGVFWNLPADGTQIIDWQAVNICIACYSSEDTEFICGAW